ncbi:MAG: T9SS type A sorting domain-containing protein [Bacteroidota bacterium]
MKKYYLIILSALLSSTLSFCQVLIPDSLYGVNSIRAFPTSVGESFIKFLLQQDGLLISAGFDYDINQNDFHIDMIRHSVCGEIDSSFGVNGLSRTTFEQRNTGYDFTLQPDGKILSVGLQAPSNAGSQQIPYVARFLTNGSPDSTFGTSGSNSLRFDNTSSGAFYSVYVLPDGRITCIGTCSGNINGGVNAPGIMRFLPDGTLDLSFNGTGILQYSTGLNSSFGKLLGFVLSNGNSIVAGEYNDASVNKHFFAVAVDSTGNPLTGYGANGLFTDTVILSQEFAACIQSDEKIILAAQRMPVTDGMEFIRLLSDGEMDPAFGTGGRSIISISNMVLRNIKTLSNDRIVVMGSLGSGLGIACCVMLNSNGLIDSTFGTNGFLLIDVNNNSGSQFLNDILELPLNRILAGASDGDFKSRRFSQTSNVPHITYTHPLLSSTGSGTFQWYRDSVFVPGAASSTYSPAATGSYTVEITDDLGCIYMSDPFVITTVGIKENPVNEYAVSPNPFNDYLHFKPGIFLQDAEIEITEATGKMVYSTHVNAGINPVINTASFSKGIYLIHISTSGRDIIQKIVK